MSTISTVQTYSPIVELRHYTLHPGQRETLIELFDREFLEGQESVGIKVIGQFRNLDDANSFVWLRGFDDMQTRQQALTGFYTGPIWQAHRNAANDTMIDSDNVLLLKPARTTSGFKLEQTRPTLDAKAIPNCLVVISIAYLTQAADNAILEYFEQALMPILNQNGAQVLASFITEPSENTYPKLPVRNEHVFIWISRFANLADYKNHIENLEQTKATALLSRWLTRPLEVLQLSPTTRSRLH